MLKFEVPVRPRVFKLVVASVDDPSIRCDATLDDVAKAIGLESGEELTAAIESWKAVR